jgi:hypothetical protein
MLSWDKPGETAYCPGGIRCEEGASTIQAFLNREGQSTRPGHGGGPADRPIVVMRLL